MLPLASACMLASLLAEARAQTVSAMPPTATLTAITPITAAWLSAPAGTPGAVVSHPAGPLTMANVVGPVGTAWATFHCDLTQGPDVTVLDATTMVFAPQGEVVGTNADLLLTLTGPPNSLATIDIGLAHLGDTPDPNGFRIDLGDDGSDELDTASMYCCGTLQRRVLTRSLANGPWLVRIRDDNTLSVSPQAYDLHLEFRIQLAGVTDIGGECGRAITTPPTTVIYSTNAQLTARPSSLPNEFGVLRAVGLGHIGLFLFADQPLLAQLPLPPFGSCDVLASTQFGDPGLVTSGTAVPSEWEVHLPALPPGLTFHVQHAWLHLGAPIRFGASNALRIDT